MATFRKVLFWTHLVSGLVAGLVIFVMSITGAALALQPQILLWAERDQRRVAIPVDQTRLGPQALLDLVVQQRPGLTPTGLTLEHDPTLAAAVTLADASAAERQRGGASRPRGPAQTTVYVNPYTGAILGQLDPSSGARRFFRVVTDWHRWLSVNGEGRTTARWVTGVSNAAFFILAITGVCIWVPRVWTWAAFRAVTFFRTGLTGKARDFNWHNVIGAWSAPVLVVLTFSGMCISFPKTYDVIYAVTGIERPAAPGGGRPGARAAGGRGERARAEGDAPREASAPRFEGLDRAWAQAEAQLPSWRSIAVRFEARPRADQTFTFTMNDRNRLSPMARSTATVDAASGAIVEWQPYESLTTGQRLRTWMRFGHTGELWGLPGQVIAGVASAGGCVLVYTGVALALRRFIAWRGRRARRLDVRERSAA